MTASGLDKAAILLLTLGPEAAAAVFRHLSEPEVRQVSGAIARLRSIPREQAAAVHEEAWRRLTERDGFLVDGEQFARQMLAAALASGGEAESRERDFRSGSDVLAATLEPIAAPVLAQVLGGEHPQVIALVLANLRPRKAAEVLGALPEELQADLVRRIAELQSVPEDLLAEVGGVLEGQVRGLGAIGQTPGFVGAKLAAEIMNAASPTLEARTFARLDDETPEVADAIRGLMLTFEDLVRLDDRAMQAVLKEIPRDDLLLALKTASPALTAKVFGNLSQRAAEILREDMSLLGAVRLRDVERAQAGIVAAARRLDAEQKIVLRAGEDDVLV
jgi:flagellar motor switch protein FliG